MSDQFEVIIVDDPQILVVEVKTLVMPDIEVTIPADPTAIVVEVDNGIAGAQGPTGPTGPTGPAGPTGPIGPAGPNNITTATTTNLTGILEGNGSVVGVATPDIDYATPISTIVNAIIFG